MFFTVNFGEKKILTVEPFSDMEFIASERVKGRLKRSCDVLCAKTAEGPPPKQYRKVWRVRALAFNG